MIKAIVFDVFGTLISTGTGSADATRKILEKRGRYDLSPAQVYSSWKKIHKKYTKDHTEFITEAYMFELGLRQIYEDYCITGDVTDDVQIMLDSLINRSAFPEAEDTLCKLHKSVPLYIGSNTDTDPLMSNLSRHAFSFDGIYTSESLRCYKPNVDFYKKIVENIKIDPNNILFVGDSLLDDIWGPQQIGMQTCWINRKSEKTSDICPDHEICDLTGLLSLI